MVEPHLKHLVLIMCQHHAGNLISVTENNHVSVEMVGVRLLPSRTRLPNSAHASIRWPTALRVCSFASSFLSWLCVVPFLWFAICRTTTLARAEDWVTDVPLLTSSVIWRQDLTSIPAQLSRAAGSVLEMLSLFTLRHTCGIVFTPPLQSSSAGRTGWRKAVLGVGRLGCSLALPALCFLTCYEARYRFSSLESNRHWVTSVLVTLII